MTTFYRTGSANTYDSAVRNITARQSALSSLQENLTAGKRVVRPSDDPTSAAIAERALTRISRIATDQRALDSQRNAIAVAESTLGSATDSLQRFRELVVSAGNGAHSSAERKAIAFELQGLRDEIFAQSNTKDTNGQPLFGAISSALAPLVGPQATPSDYTFDGLPGQSASSAVAIPFALDGDSAFMLQPVRDLSFNATVTNSVDGLIDSSRTLTTDSPVLQGPDVAASAATVQATADAALAASGAPYPKYVITFTAVGPTSATYSIQETPSVTPLGAPAAFADVTVVTGNPAKINITDIPGLSFSVSGTLKENDTITLSPSASIFSVLDSAISQIGNAANNNGSTQAVAQALHNLDIGMARVSTVRSQAGELLARAERISSNQEDRSVQVQDDRSQAEDLDMIKGISDFNNKQTGYSAALQTYAQIQKLSLFNYIG